MFRSINIENNIIKNIGKEIVRNCAHSGLLVSHDLATYSVQMKLLDPLKGYTVSKAMDRKMTQDLIDECVADLTEDSIWMNTIRMQVYWNANAVDRDEIKKDHHKIIFKKSLPILKEITEANPLSKEDTDQLYKKIVLFTVVYSGLGNPTSQTVLREANPALHSVFKTSELETFTGLSRKDKESQLMEFTRIVTGIRLFNKDCQKGGEGIDDLPVLLVQAVQATKERINNTQEFLKNRINRLSVSLERAYQLDEWKDREPEIVLPSGFKKDQLEQLKRILILMRQHDLYIKKLRSDVEESSATVLKLVDQLQKTLLQLHEVVRYRAAIPTVQVYPLFVDLSYIWSALQDETAILSHINTVVVNVNALNKYADPLPLELALSPNGLAKCDGERLLRSSSSTTSIQHPTTRCDIHVVPFSAIPDLKAVQFAGFCAWTLAQTNGLLIPGNLAIGLLDYKNKLYSFHRIEVAHKWMEDPDSYVFRAFSVARAKPELVKLLNLYNDLEAVKSEELVTIEKPTAVSQSVEVQTELHPIESYISRDYTFSEWELKRRAIRLANVTKCLTKSQQTVSHSHFRNNAGVQVNPMKTNFSQTRKDNSCNHPTVSTFIWGVRALDETDIAAKVLTLTRPIKEGAICQDFLKSKSNGK